MNRKTHTIQPLGLDHDTQAQVADLTRKVNELVKLIAYLQDNGALLKPYEDAFFGYRNDATPIEIQPSPRIDYCGACKKDHGYECPLDP